MKFVHIADMHFDTPFSSLNARENLGEMRRMEQRNAFKKVIEYIKERNIPYLFISGDLYDHQYVRRSTIEYIAKLFDEIPKTKIFISPGNHDPYIKNSFYATYEFGENVYIFRNSRIEKYEDENVNIFGMAFNDFYMNESPFEKLNIPQSSKPNILVAHLDLNGVKDKNGMSYNPILETKLSSLGFDYCAIGHIHKKYLNKNANICYPGSMISLGFDELGPHGMMVCDLNKNMLNAEFVELDDRSFMEIDIDVSDCSSIEDVVQKIIAYKFKDSIMYKVILVGERNFEIDEKKILMLTSGTSVLKIKDETKISYNIEELIEQESLKGMFVKEVINAYKEGRCTEKECQKAIEIGLNVM